MSAAYAGQFGFKKETTHGTAVVVDQFLDIDSEGITNDITFALHKGIRAGRMFGICRRKVKERPGGSVSLAMFPGNLAKLLTLCWGTPVTTGAGPYTHTYTQQASLPSATLQKGVPQVGGTVTPFTYAGAKVSSWTLKGSVGEEAKLDVEFVAKSETTGTALATASYPTGCPFVVTDATVTVEGVAYDDLLTDFEITCNNNLAADRESAASYYRKEPVRNGAPEVTGTINVDFTATTAYGQFTAGTQLTLVILLDDGAGNTFTLTAEIGLTGTTPVLSGPDGIVTQALPFEVYAGSLTDAQTFSAVYVSTTESTA